MGKDGVSVQRVYASQNTWDVTALWRSRGHHPALATDGAGGAYVVWQRDYLEVRILLYSQLLDGQGTPQWVSPALVGPDAGFQEHPAITKDGYGNAVICWQENRIGGQIDIFAQKFDDFGTTLWTTDGVLVTAQHGNKIFPRLLPGSGSNLIVAWWNESDRMVSAQSSSAGPRRLCRLRPHRWA